MEENAKPKQDSRPKVTGGLILILLGVLFPMAEMDRVSWADWWAGFVVGLGGIFLIEALLRAPSPGGAASRPADRRAYPDRHRRRHLTSLENSGCLIVVGISVSFPPFQEVRPDGRPDPPLHVVKKRSPRPRKSRLAC
jgi:hypothetical protein